jgi:hypothetical protein
MSAGALALVLVGMEVAKDFLKLTSAG